MKAFLFLIFLSFASVCWAEETWKVVSETTNCSDKIQIMAKEGEKFVYAIQGNQKTKLFSQDGSSFSARSMKDTIYKSDNKNLNEANFTFIHSSVVNGNPGKIDVSKDGRKNNCKTTLK